MELFCHINTFLFLNIFIFRQRVRVVKEMDLKSIGQYALVGSNPAVVDYYPSLHGSVVEHTPSKRKVQSSNLCEGLYIYALACGSCFLSNKQE